MIFDQLPTGSRQGARSRLFTSRRLLVFLPLVLALSLALTISFAACSDVSPAFGQYYKGRTLHLSVVKLERAPELLYLSGTKHYRIRPATADLELVLLRVKVENHTATSAIVNIDSQAAELRDFFRGKYFPIDVNNRTEEVNAPINPTDERCARSPLYPGEDACFVFLWNVSVDGISKAFELQKGHGIDGLMIFEAPKDTKFREFRWRAGDSLSIEF